MPYYFLDGIQAGATAQPLYVQAEDAEAAQARAKALGLEPTGVRPAKSITVPVTADAFRRFVLWMTMPIFLIALVMNMAMMFVSTKGPLMGGPFFLDALMVLPVVNIVANQIYLLMLDRDRMALELRELRQRLDSLNPPE